MLFLPCVSFACPARQAFAAPDRHYPCSTDSFLNDLVGNVSHLSRLHGKRRAKWRKS